jgi:integrase
VRTDYIFKEELQHLLAALMPENRLALEISLALGLRIGDVLNLRTDHLRNASQRRITVKELKTGKPRRIQMPIELYERALRLGGKVFVFEHRHDWRKHRTRQAVFKDLKRIAKAFRVKANIAPHSARKVWAVEKYSQVGLKRLQGLLGHSSEAVTEIYAYADELTARRLGLPRP